MTTLGSCTLDNFMLGDQPCGVTSVAMVASADFDGDGFAGDGLRASQISITRGVDPDLGKIMVGTAVIDLRNHDGRYSPRLSSGPYYPNVKPWIAVAVQRRDSGGALGNLYSGFLREPTVDPDPNVLQATFDAADLIERLRRVRISTPLYVGYRSDELIAAILLLAGYTGPTDFEVGSKAFPYASWRRTYALDAIQQVVDSELALFHIAANGVPTLHTRYHRVITDGVDATIDAAHGMAGLFHHLPADDIYNEALVTCYPRAIGNAGGEIWRWQEVPRSLAAGESVTLEVEYSDPTTKAECEANDVISPVAVTDYGASGSGLDKTTALSISMTAYGRYAIVVVTNTDSSPVSVSMLRLRGTPITIPNQVTVKEVNQGSIDALGGIVSTINLDQPLETQSDAARDVAAYLVSAHGTAHDRIQLTLKPADDYRLDALVNLDLDARIVVDEPDNTGLVSQAFFVNQISMTVGDDPITHQTTYEASQVEAISLIILDDPGQTFADLLGY